jgi:hypothetical protein
MLLPFQTTLSIPLPTPRSPHQAKEEKSKKSKRRSVGFLSIFRKVLVLLPSQHRSIMAEERLENTKETTNVSAL